MKKFDTTKAPESLKHVLIGHHITEKAAYAAESGGYVFDIDIKVGYAHK